MKFFGSFIVINFIIVFFHGQNVCLDYDYNSFQYATSAVRIRFSLSYVTTEGSVETVSGLP